MRGSRSISCRKCILQIHPTEEPALRVSTADFIRQFGTLANQTLSEPVTITRNARDRLVVLSVEECQRLKRRDRRVVRIEEFTDEEIAFRLNQQRPSEGEAFNDELKDGNP